VFGLDDDADALGFQLTLEPIGERCRLADLKRFALPRSVRVSGSRPTGVASAADRSVAVCADTGRASWREDLGGVGAEVEECVWRG
jgi:hypothetical protein